LISNYFSEQQNEEKKKQKAKNQDNPLSRIPGLRDASKKQAKIVSTVSIPWVHKYQILGLGDTRK
jgi:hypothetical protein